MLPDYSIIHKQDWFVEQKYQPDIQKDDLSFLSRSFERHFNERPYQEHTVFEEFNDRQEKLIGIDLAQSTFNKYDLTYRRLKEFLKVKMRKSDILLC